MRYVAIALLLIVCQSTFAQKKWHGRTGQRRRYSQKYMIPTEIDLRIRTIDPVGLFIPPVITQHGGKTLVSP